MYDPKTVETIAVHLGPGWYIGHQDTKIELKDQIEVEGSRVTFEGKPASIAAYARLLAAATKEGLRGVDVRT